MTWSEWFYYDETSPSCLRWKVDRWAGKYANVLCAAKDSVAGCLSKAAGYWSVKLNNKSCRVSQIVYELVSGDSVDGFQVDHFNGDSSDNKFKNLRKVSGKQNSRNRAKSSNNKSGKQGVFLRVIGGYRAYQARWYNEQGKLCSKSFAFSKYGAEESFRLACEYRDKMVSAMPDYTERHIKGE